MRTKPRRFPRLRPRRRFPRLRARLTPNQTLKARGLAGDPPQLPTLSLAPRFCPKRTVSCTAKNIAQHERAHWCAGDSMIFEHMETRALEEAPVEPYMYTAVLKVPHAHSAMGSTHSSTAGGRHNCCRLKEGCSRSS